MSAAKKSSRGCFFWGCLVSLLLFFVVVGGIWFVGQSAFKAVSRLVDEYTDRAPRELPKVSLPEPELERIRDRFESFRVAITDGQPAEPLVLTANELNGLIQFHSNFKDLRNHVFFEISDNLLRGEVSIPLGALDLGFGKNLFLNGSAVFDLKMDWRGLAARITEMEINGNPLPDAIMDKVRNQNILKDVDFDDDTENLLDRLKSIRIENDQLIIETRGPNEPAGGDGDQSSNDSQAEISSPAEFEQP